MANIANHTTCIFIGHYRSTTYNDAQENRLQNVRKPFIHFFFDIIVSYIRAFYRLVRTMSAWLHCQLMPHDASLSLPAATHGQFTPPDKTQLNGWVDSCRVVGQCEFAIN